LESMGAAMEQPEIDEAVLRDGVAEIRELFAAQHHPLAQATQTAMEQEVINWIKIHPEDIHLTVHDIFIKLLESNLP
jgi:hypothetical protein